MRNSNGGGEGVLREANLAGAATATLSLQYRRNQLDTSSDYVALQVSSNGSAGPWTEPTRFQGWGTDYGYRSFSQDISAYISGTTAIRLLSSSTLGWADEVWFDNIQIQCTP